MKYTVWTRFNDTDQIVASDVDYHVAYSMLHNLGAIYGDDSVTIEEQ